MSSEINKLIEQLKMYINLRGGKLTLEELIKWSEEQEISLLLLDMIVHEMIKRNIVKSSKEQELIEIGAHIVVEFPKELYIPRRSSEERMHHEEKKHRVSRKRLRSVALITEFIAKEKGIVKEKPARSTKPIKRKEIRKIQPEKKVKKALVKETRPPELEEETKKPSLDHDLEKVIVYLNRYRSVGEIRFLLDLKAMGIKDPSKVLERLLELGYVSHSPLGVINATDKLPKVKEKISEILFGV